MKFPLYIIGLLLLENVTSIAQQRPPSINSPEVHADNSVTFRYYSKTAKNVYVSGELHRRAFHRRSLNSMIMKQLILFFVVLVTGSLACRLQTILVHLISNCLFRPSGFQKSFYCREKYLWLFCK